MVTDAALCDCDAESLIESLQSDWMRWMASPKRIHVDIEGAFTAGKLADVCGRRNIRIVTCGGESHWQLGIVERHIGSIGIGSIGIIDIGSAVLCCH